MWKWLHAAQSWTESLPHKRNTSNKWQTGWSGWSCCDCIDSKPAGRGPLRAWMSPDKAQIFTTGTQSSHSLQLLTACYMISISVKVRKHIKHDYYFQRCTKTNCRYAYWHNNNTYVNHTVINGKLTSQFDHQHEPLTAAGQTGVRLMFPHLPANNGVLFDTVLTVKWQLQLHNNNHNDSYNIMLLNLSLIQRETGPETKLHR